MSRKFQVTAERGNGVWVLESDLGAVSQVRRLDQAADEMREALAYLAGLPEEDLARHAATADALVVMKIGRNLDKLRRALTAAGRISDAWLVERGTMPDQRVHRLSDAPEKVPYFSIAIVHGKGRRP